MAINVSSAYATVNALRSRTPVYRATLSRRRPSYYSEVMADEPNAFWRLGETSGTVAKNSTSRGGLNGAYVNTPTLGVTGALQTDTNKAAQFNGTNEYVAGSIDGITTSADIFTLELLVKPTASATQVLLDKGTAGFRLYLAGLTVTLSKVGTADIVASTTPLTLNVWTHVVVTKTGATVKIYQNGVDVTGVVTNQTITLTLIAFAMAATSGGGASFFTGALDEVAIFSTALSASRVAAHYYASIVPAETYDAEVAADAPSLWLRLSDFSGTVAADSSGNGLDGTYINTPTLQWHGLIAGSSDKAVRFDYLSRWITVADDPLLDPGDTFSLECWFKREGIQLSYLFDKSVNGYRVFLDVDGFVVLEKSGVAAIATSTIAITTGVTAHIVVTKTGAAVKIYINAVDVTGTVTNQTIAANASDLHIGADDAEGAFIQGVLDEVALYPTALPANRVTAHYNAGLFGGTTRFSTHKIADYHSEVLTDSPSALWRMNEASGTLMEDASGNGLDGVYVNTPTLGVTGPLTGSSKTAVTFVAASSEHATVADNPLLDFTSVCTFEFWLNPVSVAALLGVLGKGTGYALYVLSGGTLQLQRPGVDSQSSSVGAILAGVWQHVVVVFNAGVTTFYVNGAAAGGGTGIAGDFTVNATELRIGRDPTTVYFDGSLDEVAFYPTALSAARVLAHYHAGRLGQYLTAWKPYMQLPRGIAAQIEPHKGRSSNGSTSFVLTDIDGEVTDLIATIGGQHVVLEMGSTTIQGEEFVQFAAGTVEAFPLTDDLMGYEITVREPDSLTNRTIFAVGTTRVDTVMTDADLYVAVLNGAFAYSASGPLGTRSGFAIIDDEIIYYDGVFINELNPVQRGMFGTTPAEHAVGAVVKELIVFQGHPMQIARQIMTFTNNSGLSIDPGIIDQERFDAIEADIGPVEMRLPVTGPRNAKELLEQEIYSINGCYPAVRNGLISLVRYAIPDVADSVADIDHDVVVVPTDEDGKPTGPPRLSWNPGFDLMRNAVVFNYDYNPVTGNFDTSGVEFTDEASIAQYGRSPQVFNSRGFTSSDANTAAVIAAMAALFLARYRNGAATAGADVFLQRNLVEAGDITSLSSALIPNRDTHARGVIAQPNEVIRREILFDEGLVRLSLRA